MVGTSANTKGEILIILRLRATHRTAGSGTTLRHNKKKKWEKGKDLHNKLSKNYEYMCYI
jgi:hypothetical protein